MNNHIQATIAITALAAMLVSCASQPRAETSEKTKRATSMSVQPLDNVFTVSVKPTVSSGNISGCPGSYAGYAKYIKTVGWGWAPQTGTTNHTATDNNRSDTKVVYNGISGDSGCAQTTVSVPDPPASTVYRFTIYFPSNVPTTNYPLTLSGFNQ